MILENLNLKQYQKQSWYSSWQEIQNLNESEYRKYFDKSKLEGKEFRFFQIVAIDNLNHDDSNPENQNHENIPQKIIQIKFQWDYRVISKSSDENYQTEFYISPLSQLFSDGRAIMVNKETFIKYALEFGITEEEINHFFSENMEMKANDWVDF